MQFMRLCAVGIGLIAAITSLSADIYMIGDSTMADKTPKAFPETGWGQGLRTLIGDRVEVHNHAVNGRSSKSFRDEGRWDTVLAALGPDDVLVIQFGHNDMKVQSPDRYAEAWSDYTDNLRNFALEAQEKGATVILATSICRRHWTAQGFLERTLDAYPRATRRLAEELELTLVDLNSITARALVALGPEASCDWFMHLAPGDYPSAPEGKTDDTHLSPFGAETIARMFLAELRRQEADFPWLTATPPLPPLPPTVPVPE